MNHIIMPLSPIICTSPYVILLYTLLASTRTHFSLSNSQITQLTLTISQQQEFKGAHLRPQRTTLRRAGLGVLWGLAPTDGAYRAPSRFWVMRCERAMSSLTCLMRAATSSSSTGLLVNWAIPSLSSSCVSDLHAVGK